VVAAAQPAVYTVTGTGRGQGEIYVVTPDGLVLADAGRPALAGDEVLIYATGLGKVDAAVRDGAAGPADTKVMDTVRVFIQGKEAEVKSAGLVAGDVGRHVIRAIVPSATQDGGRSVGESHGDDGHGGSVACPVWRQQFRAPVVAPRLGPGLVEVSKSFRGSRLSSMSVSKPILAKSLPVSSGSIERKRSDKSNESRPDRIAAIRRSGPFLMTTSASVMPACQPGLVRSGADPPPPRPHGTLRTVRRTASGSDRVSVAPRPGREKVDE
jgi:hypothetical protein